MGEAFRLPVFVGFSVKGQEYFHGSITKTAEYQLTLGINVFTVTV